MNTKAYFVIGTDTDIGKTFCSSLLYRAIKERGGMYYKPVQSGGILKEGKLYAPDVLSVCKASGEDYQEKMTTIVLEPEVSPHLASELSETPISLEKIRKDFKDLCQKHSPVIVEGAGGLYVPLLRGEYYLYDLIREMKIPVILVSSAKVGSINHALLTLRALDALGIELHGIMFNRLQETEESKVYEEDNIRIILEHAKNKNHLRIREGQELVEEENMNLFLEGKSYEG